MKKHLFISGPTSVDERVKKALLHDDISHRDTEFEELFSSTQELLLNAVNADKRIYTSLLTTGSGTSAVEAMISSFLPKSSVLVLSNGAFGDRLYNMTKVFQCNSKLLDYEWGKEYLLDDIEIIFKEDLQIENVLTCWVETSTGVLNPINELSDLCQKYNKKLYVDSVSAIGSENIDLSGNNIECIAGHSGKALGAYPGIGIIICKRDLFKKKKISNAYYLDLNKYFDYAEKYSQTPHTPAIPLIFSLNKALKIFNNDRNKAFNRLEETYKVLSDGLEKLGIELFLASGINKCRSIIAAYCPSYITSNNMKKILSNEGYIIYGGRGYLEEKGIFLVSVMSTSITVDLVKDFINVFDRILKKAKQ